MPPKKRMSFINLLMILTILVSSGLEAYKILIFYPSPMFSHQRPLIALTERLIKEGHELFIISPNIVQGLEKNRNYTFVDLSFTHKLWAGDNEDDNSVQKHFSKWDLSPIFQAYSDLPRKQLLSEQYSQFRRRMESEKIKFDLIIIEHLFVPFACAIAEIFPAPAPIISMTTLVFNVYVEEALGSITHLSYVPSVMNSYTDQMSLWQRLENWFSHHYIWSEMKYLMEASAKRYLKEANILGKEDIVERCWSNVSLSFVLSNPLYFYPRAIGPNVIELGPLHLKPPAKLPKNLQNWLDGAEKGVIYFSLGTNVKSKFLPLEVRSNFLKFFGQLPPGYRVLWKWELDGKIPGQSDNVLAQKWLPQESVLAHPKIKAFITQGGLQSFQEAVHFGVPTVGIPWGGDQAGNVAKMVDVGIGSQLSLEDLNSYEKIKSAIEAVLYDQSYSNNMRKLSAISHDFTSRGMDQAVFWVEHVARHGGASHLRPATADTTFFEYFCLDIISVILILSSFIIYISYHLCKFIVGVTLRKPKRKSKKS